MPNNMLTKLNTRKSSYPKGVQATQSLLHVELKQARTPDNPRLRKPKEIPEL